MYIVNEGEITLNKPVTEEVKLIIDSVLNDSEIAEIGSDKLNFCEYYDRELVFTLYDLIDAIQPFGFSLVSGRVDYWGDYDGRYDIENNVVSQIGIEEYALYDSDDETLIRIMEERGYTVIKKGE